MREHKYRAWNGIRYVYIDFANGEYLDWNAYELEEYTGMKDKNGKEIYEGDILKSRWGIGEVKYNEDLGVFSWPRGEDWGMIFADTVEVIGSIRNTPELLK